MVLRVDRVVIATGLQLDLAARDLAAFLEHGQTNHDQQEAACSLQGVDADAEVLEHGRAHEREQHQHDGGEDACLGDDAHASGLVHALRQAKKQAQACEGVHDHQKRHEDQQEAGEIHASPRNWP